MRLQGVMREGGEGSGGRGGQGVQDLWASR